VKDYWRSVKGRPSLAAGLLLLVLVVTACQRGGTRSGGDQIAVSTRGPGMKRAALETLQFPAPRTFDLRHVNPQAFAAALGNDPVRIFEFVRDTIAYEAYRGVLRGPKGVLLAMAGNSVDRAALLASLLEHAGQQVRFVRGTLPDREATDLVTSMWAPRPQSSASQTLGEVPQSLKASTDAFVASTRRSYAIVRERLREAKQPTSRNLTSTLKALIVDAQSHYWVQWAKEGTWIDLDPSFGDATPGRTYAKAEETFTTLPDSLFHRVSIRVRVEEVTDASPATRTLLTYEGKAASLSGIDLVLFHQPENWRGPAASVPGAISAAIEDTGRLKPVLVIGEEILIGDVFLQKAKTTGIGGVSSLLRRDARGTTGIVVAEWLEFDFLAPGGTRETVTRDLLDVVGKLRRVAKQPLTLEEVVSRTQGDKAVNMARAVYSLLFTTGRIDTAHFSQLAEDAAPHEGEAPDIRRALRRINVAFVATSDGLLPRLYRPGGTAVVFYPDTPRLTITELSALSGILRIGIDLRRNWSRAVAIRSQDDVFLASVFRGVMDGALEWILIEHIVGALREKHGWPMVVSTSSVFDQAGADRVPFLLLPRDNEQLQGGVAHEGLVRVREEVDQGYLAIVPQRPVSVSGLPRFAWWRIDPRTGETTGVTDDGLHQAIELNVEHNKSTGETTITWREFVGNAVNLATTQTVTVATGSLEMGRFLGALLTAARVINETVVR